MGRSDLNWGGAYDFGSCQDFFYLSPDQDRLEKMGDGLLGGKNLREKKDICLTLLTSSLLSSRLALLEGLEENPLELVSGIHKVYFLWLSPSIFNGGSSSLCEEIPQIDLRLPWASAHCRFATCHA